MKKRATLSRPLHTAAAIAFLVYLAALTWFFVVKRPAYFWSQIENFRWEDAGKYANYVPGRTLLYYLTLQENAGTGFEQIGGNLFGFLPFGVLLPLACNRARRLAPTTALAALLSLLFEVFQFFTNVGSFDVDDLLLNVSGAVCGLFLVRWVVRACSL